MLNRDKFSPAFGVSLTFALALSACDNNASTSAEQPEAIAQDEPAPLAAQSAPVAAPARADDEQDTEAATREIAIEEIAGGWRVARVEGAKAGSQSANMIGAIAEIYPESASWSYKPKGAGALNDFCQEPVAGIVRSTAAQKAVKDRLAVPGKRIADKAVPHELMCGGGGSFGDSEGSGTDIALIAPDNMAMTWDDGTVLILEKMDRPAPKDDMQPQDYRASDYNRE